MHPSQQTSFAASFPKLQRQPVPYQHLFIELMAVRCAKNTIFERQIFAKLCIPPINILHCLEFKTSTVGHSKLVYEIQTEIQATFEYFSSQIGSACSKIHSSKIVIDLPSFCYFKIIANSCYINQRSHLFIYSFSNCSRCSIIKISGHMYPKGFCFANLMANYQIANKTIERLIACQFVQLSFSYFPCLFLDQKNLRQMSRV